MNIPGELNPKKRLATSFVRTSNIYVGWSIYSGCPVATPSFSLVDIYLMHSAWKPLGRAP